MLAKKLLSVLMSVVLAVDLLPLPASADQSEASGDESVVVIEGAPGVDYVDGQVLVAVRGGQEALSTDDGKYGYNAVKSGSRNDSMDHVGHGTHCASTIAAAWNNVGIAGINNKVKIMAVRAVGLDNGKGDSLYLGVIGNITGYGTLLTPSLSAYTYDGKNWTANLKPVPESITDNGDGTFTLSGSFFGDTPGSVKFDDTTLEVKSWSDSDITFGALTYENETIGKIMVSKTNGPRA